MADPEPPLDNDHPAWQLAVQRWEEYQRASDPKLKAEALARYQHALRRAEAIQPKPVSPPPSSRVLQNMFDVAPLELSRQGEVVPDMIGLDLCPDPLAAQSESELMHTLRRYRLWAGQPPVREIARRAHKAGYCIGASTVHTALRRDELPSLKVFIAIVIGCGGSPADEKRFAAAWRWIKFDELPHHYKR